MTMDISQLQIDIGDTRYYTDGFRRLYEDHLEYVKKDAGTVILDVTPIEKIKYTGDFFGLLVAHRVKQDLHWVSLRLTGLTSTGDYSPRVKRVLVPGRTLLDNLLSKYGNINLLT